MDLDKEPWVHLIEQTTYNFEELIPKIKDLFTVHQLNMKNKTVFLKVSFVFPVQNFERTKMIITNPVLIAAVCEVCTQFGAKTIYIGDGETLGVARYSFKMVEIEKYIKKTSKLTQKKVVYCYLDECVKEWTTPINPFIPEIKLDYPKIVKDVDIFITMPKLKVNIFADLTLSVKNGMGLIQTRTRWKYHKSDLHELIADIYQVRTPDYVLTDAIFAGEGQGPMEATPYPSNLILFGNNGLAVDTVASIIMDYDPSSIRHLRILNERGYGPINLNQIKLFNAEFIQKHKHTFIHASQQIDQLSPQIHCYLGTACESGCPAFLKAMLDGYGRNKGWDSIGELHVIMGKNPPITQDQLKKLPKKRTIVYGECAKAFKKYGVYYKGCPPNYIYAMLFFPLRTKLGMSPWFKYVKVWPYGTTTIIHFIMSLFGKKWGNLKQ